MAVRIGGSKSIQVTTRIISSKKEVDPVISTRKMRRRVEKEKESRKMRRRVGR